MRSQSKIKVLNPRRQAIERVAAAMAKVGIDLHEMKSWKADRWKGIGRLAGERGIKDEVVEELGRLYREQGAK